MNFIAHLYLSGRIEPLMVGNFIADGIKGSSYIHYPEDIQKGILLHRHIDQFTDQHALVHASKRFFVDEFNHYSGIIVDILFDHLLTKNWGNFSGTSLEKFSAYAITVLNRNKKYLNHWTASFLEYIIIYDRIYNYNQINTLTIVLNQMERRFNLPLRLAQSVHTIQANFDMLENNFLEFFPQLKSSCIKKIYTFNLQESPVF